MGRKQNKRLTRQRLNEILQDFFARRPDETLTFKQIFKLLRINTHPARMLAFETMEDMVWDDYLTKVGDNSYRLNLKGQVQEGRFIRKAYGRNSFVPDDGGKPVFVSERNSLFALTGDRVRVAFMARRHRHVKEAMVIQIIKRAHDTIVGNIITEDGLTFLTPDGGSLPSDVIIPRDKLNGARDGDKALVKVVKWPSDDSRGVIGEVTHVLGHKGDNDAEMHAILAQYGLPYDYPREAEEAAERISADITPQDYAEREDFRHVTTFTIDPKDAKDFDDALSIRPLGKDRWEVGVHIADVSHYVAEGSVIDKEARRRATSVYLVDRTIPMLPERLCNFICSLRPHEEKLTYSAVFELDADANVKDWRLTHAVIRSDRRFTYEEVQETLELNGVKDGTGEPAPAPGPEGYQGEYAEELVTLDRLAKRLRAERFKHGSVKFDREELRFDVDETGKPLRCYFKKSKDANKLIEEFMLLANRSVAESVGKTRKGVKPKTLPYRVHDMPDPTKLETLREFIAKFGYRLKTEGTRGELSRGLNKLMNDCSGRKEQSVIERVALRAMMKARYSVSNIGHYGLGFDYYTHFTSPIRRYPDTMVHRLLTSYQQGGRGADKAYYEDLCKHSSDMEVTAQNAERDSVKYKMVEFMADKVGEEFDAHVSGITSYGIYCEIDDNHCEGMVPIHDLDGDYYEFDEREFCLRGRRRGHRYQLGDAIRIRVARANLEKRQLDFTLARD